MANAGLRIGVIGATGAVGAAVLEALERSALRVAQVAAVAGERSLGAELEFGGEPTVVTGAIPDLHGFDGLFLCAPPDVSREAARAALRSGVPAIDLSGALAAEPEIPLCVAALGADAGWSSAPLLAAPSGAALALTLALSPLAQRSGLVRVVATLLGSASAGGSRGSDALLRESLALFNQQEPPEPEVFARPIAFDCGPGAEDDLAREARTVAELGRTLGPAVSVHVTALQVPTFLGLGCAIALDIGERLSVSEAEAVLAKAPGIDLWSEGGAGPTLRAAAGRDTVLVGRVRENATSASGLALWIACDPVCLAAANAVELAESRLLGA